MEKFQLEGDDNDQFSYAMACTIAHEARTIIAEVIDERRFVCDHIMRKYEEFSSDMALLNQASESYITDLQATTNTMVDSLSDKGAPLSKLHNQSEAAERRLVQLNGDIQEKNRQIASFEQEREYLLSAKEELVNYSRLASGSVVNFYHASTKIRWDFDTEPHKVVGLIAEPNNIATFDLDTNQNSMFFIINKIWNLMLNARVP